MCVPRWLLVILGTKWIQSMDYRAIFPWHLQPNITHTYTYISTFQTFFYGNRKNPWPWYLTTQSISIPRVISTCKTPVTNKNFTTTTVKFRHFTIEIHRQGFLVAIRNAILTLHGTGRLYVMRGSGGVLYMPKVIRGPGGLAWGKGEYKVILPELKEQFVV